MVAGNDGPIRGFDHAWPRQSLQRKENRVSRQRIHMADDIWQGLQANLRKKEWRVEGVEAVG